MVRARATVLASVTWRPTTVRLGSVLWRTLQDSHRWLWSLRKLTPLWTRVQGPSHLRKHMPRNYDNGGKTSHHLHRCSQYSMLRPMRMARGAPIRSNTTS